MFKKKPNKIIYTLIMSILFIIITEFIMWGVGGRTLIQSIFYYPLGNQIIQEIVLAFLSLIVMLLFKNFYVFTQKNEKITKGLYYGLFCLIFSTYITIIGVVEVINNGSYYVALNALILSLFVGICEEFLCRGWLLNEFLERFGDNKKGVIYSIIVSSIIFGLMHFGNVQIQSLSETICQIINAIGIGILFGTIYYKTKNIWSVIILHAFWDFSLFLAQYATPTLSMTESITKTNLIGIILNIILLLTQIYAISPVLFNIEDKPNNRKILIRSIVGICLYVFISIISTTITTTYGETYEYETIEIKEYYLTQDNLEIYNMIYDKKTYTPSTEEPNVFFENVDTYSFKLYNKENNLILENTTTKDNKVIKCNELYDYQLLENDNNYVIAYLDYDINSNMYLNYTYIEKDKISNEKEFLSSIEFNKILIPDIGYLYVLKDASNNKSYITAYDLDYGYYLLDENKILRLN